jgi:oxygen-independent coproporphyrinogen-3 oxidase
VAHDPPFLVWTPEGASVGLEVLGRPSAAVPLGVYLHIPFCRKRCHFCYFRVYVNKSAREVEQYLDVLASE